MTSATRVAELDPGQQGAGLAARSASARTLTGPAYRGLTNDHRRQA